MDKQTPFRFTAVCALVLALGLTACGGPAEPTEKDPIQALDLLTGQVETFDSASDVPAGYVVCDSPTCAVPSDVACSDLGETLCQQQPHCRLQAIWCPGSHPDELPDDSSVDPAGSEEAPAPADACEYACVAAGPEACEALEEQSQCESRPDCRWDEAACPPCPDGSSDTCFCPSACITEEMAICQVLDQANCQIREDCQWEEFCPGCTSDDDRPDESSDSEPCECQFSCQPVELPEPDPTVVDPVASADCQRTGCSGQICSDQEMVSTCEWVDYYGCYELAECGLNENGSCGWISNPVFEGCMAQYGQTP